MRNNTPIPFFPQPPAEYSREYMSQLTRNFAVYAEQIQKSAQGVVPIANGGTGATTAADARTNLGLGAVAVQNTVPIANGGTGATTAADARTNLGLGAVAVQNTVPIANGGTGATTAADARTNLGLGTASVANTTTSQIDSTIGRVLKVGDFGIGNLNSAPPAVPGNDIDGFSIPNGLYYFNNLTSGTLPPNTGSTYVLLQNWRRAPNSIFQMAIQSLFSPDRIDIWVRNSIGNPPNSWLYWRRVYLQDNIIGTVSQQNNLPTGSIIEPGSNSNGDFVRYADGTQICTYFISMSIAIDISFMGGFRSDPQTWVYPAAFINTPKVFAAPRNSSSFGGLVSNIPTTTSVNYAFTAITSQSAGTRGMMLMAVGRWF
jgi:hypothetical protein